MKLFIKKIIFKLNSILKRYNLRVTIQSTKKLFNFESLSSSEIQKINKILKLKMVSEENLIFLVSAIKCLRKIKSKVIMLKLEYGRVACYLSTNIFRKI